MRESEALRWQPGIYAAVPAPAPWIALTRLRLAQGIFPGDAAVPKPPEPAQQGFHLNTARRLQQLNRCRCPAWATRVRIHVRLVPLDASPPYPHIPYTHSITKSCYKTRIF